jgi:hypothetical protein
MMVHNNIGPKLLNQLIDAKGLAANRLLRPNYFANVVGVGIGAKDVDNTATPTFCVRIYVVSKVGLDDLSPAEVIPSSFLDIPTDVIEVGQLGQTGPRPYQRCEACGEPFESTDEWLTHRTNDCKLQSLSRTAGTYSPQGPGSKIRVKATAPNVNSSAMGTLGAVVRDGHGTQYILGCNHTLAVNGRVPQGSPIVSAEFVGQSTLLAKRYKFIELRSDRGNAVDCAIAEVIRKPRKRVDAKFPASSFKLGSGAPAKPALGMDVQKLGGATGLTKGTVVDCDADLFVTFSFGTFRFDHQVIIDGGEDYLFASVGDSGALVVDTGARPQARAMIFAASGQFAVACPLEDALGKQLVGRRLTFVV